MRTFSFVSVDGNIKLKREFNTWDQAIDFQNKELSKNPQAFRTLGDRKEEGVFTYFTSQGTFSEERGFVIALNEKEAVAKVDMFIQWK